MNQKEKELVGALIGLAKACNVHLKTENTDNIIIQSLACIFESDKEQQLEKFLKRVRKEKLTVAPDCATCLNPCGNTDEYNLDELQNPEVSQNVRDLKMELLNTSYKLAFNILHDNIKDREAEIKALYKALCVISYDVTEERVRIVFNELKGYF